MRFKNTTANTGAVTLNVNGLGAKSVVKNGGTALASGNLKAGGVYTVAYDGTSFILQDEGGEYGTATAPDVLSGKTIGTDAGLVTGTIPNRGTFNLGLGVSVPSGYYSGGTTASGKRWASGTTSASSSVTSGFNTSSGISNGYYTVSVTGLSFTPSFVLIRDSSSVSFETIYDSRRPTNYKVLLLTDIQNTFSGCASIKEISPVSITSSGFLLPYSFSNSTVDWIAFE